MFALHGSFCWRRTQRRQGWKAVTILLVAVLFTPFGVACALADQTPPDMVPNLENDPASPVIGNPKGSLTIIDFFDYRCPYCRAMDPLLRAAVAKNHNIRLVFKDWPLFGGVSVDAARVAIAAGFQGKYLPVHEALFALHDMDEASIRAAAAKAGANMARLDEDLAQHGAEIDAILARDVTEAQTLNFLGAPGLVIGTHVSAGAMQPEALQALIQAQSAAPR